VGLAAEFLAPQAQLEQAAGRAAVHIGPHRRKDAPGGETLQRQQSLGTGQFAQAGNLLHVLQKPRFVDQVKGCRNHGLPPEAAK
jgi:hypothetical protein